MAAPNPDSSPATIPIEADLVLETCHEMSPEQLEQSREAFRLELAGKTQKEIAEILNVSRPTVARRLSRYREHYRRELESTPRIHLISEQLRRYQELASDALRDAENCVSDRARSAHRSTALQAWRNIDALCLSTGAFPKAPEQSIIATTNLSADAELPDHEKSPDELRADILQILRYGRKLL